MATRISIRLVDPRLVRLLEREADQAGSAVEDVVARAVEAWVAHRRDRKAPASPFSDWDDPRDADYDRL